MSAEVTSRADGDQGEQPDGVRHEGKPPRILVTAHVEPDIAGQPGACVQGYLAASVGGYLFAAGSARRGPPEGP